ncbi:MAG: tripartite tricarboxylate transporter substrate-binding protein [Burkholderiaceae bacterium]
MLLGMMLRASRGVPDNFNYLATSSGGDAVRALNEGKAQIGISGYSEFRSAIEAGTIRALAISSRRGKFNLASLRDGGIDTELANWRGVFAPSGISATQTAALAALVEGAAKSPEWLEMVRRNDWQATYRGGADFRSFVETEQTMARVVVHMLKLKA